tara:strand:+ start:1285 stop:2388 length:1104 start_codon:yes stop_codon:yes gene_type:complete
MTDPITQRLWMPSGDDFTDACWFMNAESNSTAAGIGTLDLYNSSPTETAWEVPAGVTSVSIAVMGCGGGGQQYGSGAAKPVAVGGGEMMWVNNVSVTPGQTLYVHAGCGYSRNGATLSYDGTSGDVAKYISDTTSGIKTTYTDAAVADYSRASYVRAWVSGHKWIAYAAGGDWTEYTGGNNAGAWVTDATYKYATLSNEGTDWRHEAGGDGGGMSNEQNWWLNKPRGSGGAAGYTGGGGDGGACTTCNGNAGSGGGAGGGAAGTQTGNYADQARGGNTFMWGSGTSGARGDYNTGDNTDSDGHDGSQTGTGASTNPPDGLGEGGGGGSEGWSMMNGHTPQYDGWVRIVWSKDGTTRNFPSTNVAYPG